MPQIITLPRAPDTSLSNLGGVILGGVNDMADRRLVAERQGLVREQQLADVQDTRAYNERLHGIVREEERADEQKWRPSAEAMAARLDVDEQSIRRQMEALAADIGAPPAAPTEAEIFGRARQLWAAANPGKQQPTTPEKLAAEIAQAQDELQERAVQNWQVKQLSGREIFKNLKERLDSIDASRRSLANLRVFAQPAPAGSAPAGQPPAPPPLDIEAARAKARAAAVGSSGQGGSQPPPTVAASTDPLSFRAGAAVREAAPRIGGLVMDMAETPAAMTDLAQSGIVNFGRGLTGAPPAPAGPGIFRRAGEAIGSLFSDDGRPGADDDMILRAYPDSPKAAEIRARRAQEEAIRARRMLLQDNTPGSFTPAAANPLRGLVAPGP